MTENPSEFFSVRKLVRLLLTVAFLSGMAVLAQAQAANAFDPLQSRGTVIARLTCLGDAAQSYALYLPSSYSPDRRWPIIYAFDPLGRGTVPVELYKQAAEKYGYIVAASNNARNGPAALEMAAGQAVWYDTHERLAIDKDRVYTTGFSGGARFATFFALYCYTCSVAGVIAHGAGYPKERSATNDHFLYYAAIGNADFNYPEIIALRTKKEEHGASFKVKIYDGPHQWAPPEVVQDAIEWLELKAMQSGRKKPDPAFVHGLFQKVQAEAAQSAQSGDVITEFYALRSIVFDFKGLEDVTRFESPLSALKSSKLLKKANREQNQAIEKQNSLTATTSSDISQLGTVGLQQVPELRERIMSVFSELRRQAKSGSRDHLIYVRAINQLLLEGIEDGQEQFRSGEYERAAAYFELMADAAPDQSSPLLLLAETRVRTGDKKAALKALQAAVKRGVKSQQTLTQDPELAPLFSDPEFQRIVQDVGRSKAASPTL